MSASNRKCRVAAIQMVSGADLRANLGAAQSLLEEASARGARLAVLPENFGCFSASGLGEVGIGERTAEGPLRSFLIQQARALGIWIIGGTLPVAAPRSGKLHAACFVVSPEGTETARYDKMHLFDAEVDDAQQSYRESTDFCSGEQAVVTETAAGKTGLAVCYDLRFAEQFRVMATQGCEVCAVPAAFTAETGSAHWSVLMRARAIENFCWMIGAGQGGAHSEHRHTWGHSMIVDPWGNIVAEAGQGEAVITAELDLDRVAQLRSRMPVLKHMKFSISAC